MPVSLTSRVAWLIPALLIVEACVSGERATAPRFGPEFAISDGGHGSGTPGFYFLPPIAQPTFGGSFDADITTLNPQIAICDITSGPDNDCGGAGGTSAVIVFTTTSTPAITVNLTTEQYQVTWDTRAAGFVAGHTYRVHVTAGASGARRELGFADVLLSTTPGQAKDVTTGDVIVAKDGRTLPINFRIEAGIVGSVSVSAATPSVATGGTDLLTAGVEDLHGAPLAGATVAWAVTAAPGVVASLAPMSGPTTLLTAGTAPGSAVVTATSAGVSATVAITVVPSECDCWTTKASMPTARYALGVGEIGGVLYAVGGLLGSTPLATVEAYDPAGNTWTTKASMPTARHRLAVGVVNGILYAVGGFGNLGSPPALLATVEAYDPATNSWTTRASMPTARNDLAVGVANGILYAIGGISGAVQGVATVEAYDPATDTWTTKAPMPTARFGLGVATINGKLYAVGGASNAPGGAQYATLEVYDPATDTWTTKASMSATRHLLALGAINGKLYAVGGERGGATITGSVEAYDPVTDLWTTKAAMPTVRAFLGVGVVNGLLYAVGGAGPPPFTPLGTVEAYHP